MSGGIARRAVRVTGGLALGAASAPVELVYVVLAVPVLAIPGVRRRVLAGALVLTRLDQGRLVRFLGGDRAQGYDGWRALRYLAVRCVAGMIGLGIFLLIVWGSPPPWRWRSRRCPASRSTADRSPKWTGMT